MECIRCGKKSDDPRGWFDDGIIQRCPECGRYGIFEMLGDALRPGPVPEYLKRMI